MRHRQIADGLAVSHNLIKVFALGFHVEIFEVHGVLFLMIFVFACP